MRNLNFETNGFLTLAQADKMVVEQQAAKRESEAQVRAAVKACGGNGQKALALLLSGDV